MKKNNQTWVRLGKNLTTLIVVTALAIFFYVYKPQKPVEYVASDTLINQPAQTVSTTAHLPDTIVDPNTATVDELMRIGMSQKQASQCVNYRTKGGVYNRENEKYKILK